MVVQRTVTNTATLIEAARECCLGFGKTSYWFRGHASEAWQLVPSVHRHYDNTGEQNLTKRFFLGAPSRHPKCPRREDWAGWLCLMQHYGLPTRLLDWSTSLLAAVYFAVVHEPHPGPAAVWVLVPSQLNVASSVKKDQICVLGGPESGALIAHALNGGAPVDDVIAVMGADVDSRMTNQQGTFTIHGTAVPLDQRPGAERFLAKFLIPGSAKPTLDEELWVLGIRRSLLFPDIANFAKELSSDSRLIPRKPH